MPLKQWLVGRELRKRIAATFKARDIEAPVAHMNVTVENLEELLKREDWAEDRARCGSGASAPAEIYTPCP